MGAVGLTRLAGEAVGGDQVNVGEGTVRSAHASSGGAVRANQVGRGDSEG